MDAPLDCPCLLFELFRQVSLRHIASCIAKLFSQEEACIVRAAHPCFRRLFQEHQATYKDQLVWFVAQGDQGLVDFLFQFGIEQPCWRSVVHSAGYYGHPSLLDTYFNLFRFQAEYMTELEIYFGTYIALGGSIECMQWYQQRFPEHVLKNWQFYIYCALSRSHLKLASFLSGRYQCGSNPILMSSACNALCQGFYYYRVWDKLPFHPPNGPETFYQLFQWVEENSVNDLPSPNSHIFSHLGQLGDKDILTFVADKGYACYFDSWLWLYLMKGNHLDTMKWLYNQSWAPSLWLVGIGAETAGLGRLDILQWLYSVDASLVLDQDVMVRALHSQHLAVVKWLDKLGCPRGTCTDAVSTSPESDLSCLKWAHKHGFSWSKETWIKACRCNLPALKWLAKKGCPRTKKGWKQLLPYSLTQFTTLEWLLTNCPNDIVWDESVCACASRLGNLELLDWLRTHDPPCPWDSQCYISKNPDILKYLEENGCPND